MYHIYLDLSKAFNKVDHTKLRRRLYQYSITGKLHDWFHSYLQGRKQQVTVLEASSQELPVTSGEPLGSLLGLILFLLFVDDLLNAVKTLRVACYANDTKIFKSIHSITDCNDLHSNLNDLVSWSESSGLIFNQLRCKYQRITFKNSPVQPNYTINETPLVSCDTEKYLGVRVSSNLTWDKQVTEQCGKDNKLLGFVRRASGTSKAPKCIVHCTFLSFGAILAVQLKFGQFSPLAYLNYSKTCSTVQLN